MLYLTIEFKSDQSVTRLNRTESDLFRSVPFWL